MLELNIKKAMNGYVLTSYIDDMLDEITVVENLKGDVENAADLLHEVLEHFGPLGSKHDEKRVYVITAPGENHSNFTDAHADLIWPE